MRIKKSDYKLITLVPQKRLIESGKKWVVDFSSFFILNLNRAMIERKIRLLGAVFMRSISVFISVFSLEAEVTPYAIKSKYIQKMLKLISCTEMH